MPLRTKTLGALLLIASSSLVVAFVQPPEAEPLAFRSVTERLETVDMPRIRLEGRETIQMDTPTNMFRANDETASFSLVGQYMPDCRLNFYVYREGDIASDITPESVTRYVQLLAEEAAENEESFEIVRLPDSSTGPAIIRFLSARPVTATYARTLMIEDKPVKVIYQDSWVSIDGNTYLLRIEAPERRFKAFFDQCRALVGTMHFQDS